jgi:hypothetical protein
MLYACKTYLHHKDVLKKVLRRIFRLRREEVTGAWVKL